MFSSRAVLWKKEDPESVTLGEQKEEKKRETNLTDVVVHSEM